MLPLFRAQLPKSFKGSPSTQYLRDSFTSTELALLNASMWFDFSNFFIPKQLGRYSPFTFSLNSSKTFALNASAFEDGMLKFLLINPFSHIISYLNGLLNMRHSYVVFVPNFNGKETVVPPSVISPKLAKGYSK